MIRVCCYTKTGHDDQCEDDNYDFYNAHDDGQDGGDQQDNCCNCKDKFEEMTIWVTHLCQIIVI